MRGHRWASLICLWSQADAKGQTLTCTLTHLTRRYMKCNSMWPLILQPKVVWCPRNTFYLAMDLKESVGNEAWLIQIEAFNSASQARFVKDHPRWCVILGIMTCMALFSPKLQGGGLPRAHFQADQSSFCNWQEQLTQETFLHCLHCLVSQYFRSLFSSSCVEYQEVRLADFLILI